MMCDVSIAPSVTPMSVLNVVLGFSLLVAGIVAEAIGLPASGCQQATEALNYYWSGYNSGYNSECDSGYDSGYYSGYGTGYN